MFKQLKFIFTDILGGIFTNIRLAIQKNYIIYSVAVVTIQPETNPGFFSKTWTYFYEHPLLAIVYVCSIMGAITFLGVTAIQWYANPTEFFYSLGLAKTLIVKGVGLLFDNLGPEKNLMLMNQGLNIIPTPSPQQTVLYLGSIVATTFIGYQFLGYVKSSLLNATTEHIIISEPVKEVIVIAKTSKMLELYNMCGNFLYNHWFSLIVMTIILCMIPLLLTDTKTPETKEVTKNKI